MEHGALIRKCHPGPPRVMSEPTSSPHAGHPQWLPQVSGRHLREWAHGAAIGPSALPRHQGRKCPERQKRDRRLRDAGGSQKPQTLAGSRITAGAPWGRQGGGKRSLRGGPKEVGLLRPLGGWAGTERKRKREGGRDRGRERERERETEGKRKREGEKERRRQRERETGRQRDEGREMEREAEQQRQGESQRHREPEPEPETGSQSQRQRQGDRQRQRDRQTQRARDRARDRETEPETGSTGAQGRQPRNQRI